jgi:hypothetical protein
MVSLQYFSSFTISCNFVLHSFECLFSFVCVCVWWEVLILYSCYLNFGHYYPICCITHILVYLL